MIEGEQLLGDRFPRNLAETAPLTLPISISVVSSLTTRKVQSALFSITSRASANIADRKLRGCLVAHRGQGLIFLDEDDPSAVRFAAAHEIAHFVGHYLGRREMAVARLGPRILEVLDGKREATPAERIGGILAGCPLGVFTDLMERQGGLPTTIVSENMEYEADAAAFYALAPIGSVIAHLMDGVASVSQSAVIATLVEEFGLSTSDAGRYAPRVLSVAGRSQPSFVDGLRMAASKRDVGRQR
jgi:hypothetical protein